MESSDHPIAQSPNFLIGGVWLLVLAALLLLCGSGAGLFYVVMPFVVSNQASAVQANTWLGSFAALCVLFSALLAWQGLTLARQHATRSAARAFPPAIFLLGGFLFTLLLGLNALTFESFTPFVFPPFHFLASILPPLALIAYAARQLNVTSGLRAVVGALSWGALGGTFLALSLEVLIGVIIFVSIGVWAALSPDTAAQLERLSVELRTLRAMDGQTLARFLRAHPPVIVLALVFFAGIVPLIEEAVKTLIVAFADPRRTRVRDMVLWGIAAGSGFAMTENALNGSTALRMWAVVMLARVGATVMHAANGITMARGWYAARVERRWRRLFIAYGISVFIHAVWNALVISQAVSALGVMNDLRAWRIESAGAWVVLALMLGLIALTAGGVGWIVYAVRRAREPSSPQIEMEGETNA